MTRSFYSTCFLFLLGFVAACSSVEVTERDTHEGDKMPFPGRMIVHDFVANPADVPPESALSLYKEGAEPLTAEEIEIAEKLGAELAKQLTAELREMGLPAVQAEGQPAPQINDIVFKGYFVSVYEGSAAKRVIIGFGYGNAELTTAVEGYQMTAEGLQRFGGGKFDIGGYGTPGAVVPVGVAAATANPVGLIVGGAVKVTGEAMGQGSIDSAVELHVDEIAAQIKGGAESQGWI